MNQHINYPLIVFVLLSKYSVKIASLPEFFLSQDLKRVTQCVVLTTFSLSECYVVDTPPLFLIQSDTFIENKL